MSTLNTVIQILNEWLLFSIFLYYVRAKTIFDNKECFFRYFIIILLVISEFPRFPFSYSAISSILYYLYLILFSKETFLKKTWLYIKFIIGSLSCYLLIKLLIMQVFDWFPIRTNPLYDDIKSLFIYLLIYTFCRLVFTPIQNSQKKGTSHMPYYKKLLLALFILPTTLLCIAAYLFNANDTAINTSMLIFILIILSILIFALLLITSMSFLEQEQQRHFLEQLLQQREMSLTYYEDVSNAMLQVSKLRHDFKNHLILICDYIEHHEYELAIHYARQIIDLSHSPVEEVFTNNATVSAVLNVKRTKCQELGIPLKLHLSFPKIYHLEDIHIVAILGNLLDNAISATSKLAENERMISLSIRQIDSYLDITCQNSFDGIVRLDHNGNLKSFQSQNGREHGFGMCNIKDAVSKYNGELDINYDNNIFTIHILLPNHD